MELKWEGNYYELNCATPLSPDPGSYAKFLTPSLTVFGDRAFMEVIKVK